MIICTGKFNLDQNPKFLSLLWYSIMTSFLLVCRKIDNYTTEKYAISIHETHNLRFNAPLMILWILFMLSKNQTVLLMLRIK